MKTNEVPQDKLKHYDGQHKLLYAKDESGNYSTIKSSGWEIEETATLDAVEEYQRLAVEAKNDYKKGKVSPLVFHMYDKRMDVPFLSQAAGVFQWQLKRHFHPQVFAKLSEKKLKKYSDLFGISVEELKTITD